MSRPANGVIRGTMSVPERNAYDRGWGDAEVRAIKLIEAEIERVSAPMLVDREYLDGLEMAIDILKGTK